MEGERQKNRFFEITNIRLGKIIRGTQIYEVDIKGFQGSTRQRQCRGETSEREYMACLDLPAQMVWDLGFVLCSEHI